MSISTTSGTCIIPTLSRLVLCAAFLPAGWVKIMEKTEFSGDDAQRLIELGVIDAPTQANIGLSRSIVPASWQDDPATADPAPAETQDLQAELRLGVVGQVDLGLPEPLRLRVERPVAERPSRLGLRGRAHEQDAAREQERRPLGPFHLECSR